MRVRVDPLGRRLITSARTKTSLELQCSTAGFVLKELEGDPRSALMLLRAALPRVAFDGEAGVVWRDYLPHLWTRSVLRLLFGDFAAPFVQGGGLEMLYGAHEAGSRLVVTGASTRTNRRGDPLVKTKATLVRHQGLVAVEITTHGKTRALTVERQEHAGSAGLPALMVMHRGAAWAGAAQ